MVRRAGSLRPRVALKPEETIDGRYRVLYPLVHDGAARVFVAERAADGQRLVVKILPTIHTSTEEFRREVTAAARARHPNLVSLVDAGILPDGRGWLVMEWVRGKDLRTRLGEGPVPVAEAVRFALDVFAALDALHRLGLAHGDIKPENVLLDGSRARVVDYGRAWLPHVYGGGDGVYPGTPAYMHPSLFFGGTPYALTDCFAAWIMLYELVVGERPYPSSQLRTPSPNPLPPPRPFDDEALYELIVAGLDGRLAHARRSWLALRLYQDGRRWVPERRLEEPRPDPALNERLWKAATQERSTALVGDEAQTRPALEALHRRWEDAGGTVLWARGDGDSQAPLAGALALVANAADTLDGPRLATAAAELGPLGQVLWDELPAVRAWLAPPAERLAERPGATRLALAIERFLGAVPGPLLVLVDGLDRLDGASRRLIGAMVSAGDLRVIGSASPGEPHGLPAEVTLPQALDAPVPGAALTPVTRALVARASLLGLPLDARLARVAGRTPEEVEWSALEAEAAGVARWTGREVVARRRLTVDEATARGWYREAAYALDPAQAPLDVARFALLGGDPDRLVDALEPAVEEALRVDPHLAIDLLAADPRPASSAGLLRHLRVALLAREMEQAAAILERMRRAESVVEADLAEAEGEYAFVSGRTLPAISAFRRAARALGRPVAEGPLGAVWDVLAVARFALGRRLPPRPDERLGRLFERLHDAQFHHDQAPLLRVHQLWLQAAPTHPRARAMDLVWHVALGQEARAASLEAALVAEMQERRDPVGTASVLLIRAIARVLRGEVLESHQDAVDAADRLLRVGDPYLAGLAASTLGVTAFHLGTVLPLRRAVDQLERLARATKDARALAWVDGCRAIVHWTAGDLGPAVELARGWAASAEAEQVSSEALARRFLGDLLLESGDWRGALRAYAQSEAVSRRYHLRTDFTQAAVLGVLVADGHARLAGERGVGWRGWRRRQARRLAARSPRWGPRAKVAEAWQLVADGKVQAAREAFDAAVREAEDRRQNHDAWWALAQRARALRDAEAEEAASTLARVYGLKSGVEAVRA